MRQGRALVIIVGMIAVVASGAAATAVVFQMRERDLRLQRESELKALRSEKVELEQQYNSVQEAKEQLEGELGRARTQFDQLTKQLTDERESKAMLVKSIDERQREIDRLSKDAEQWHAEREQLTEQLTKLKSEEQELQAQLAQMQQAKSELETKMAALPEQPTVELDRVVVTDGASPSSTATGAASPGGAFQPAGSQVSAVQGQVIVVNREYDFVVINMGRNQGLEVGQEFRLVRGDRVVGRVKVEKLYDELSAASIMPESDRDAIREGDLVKAI
ncbi:MAG: hypothetical protein HYZ92_05640 [Candidatus Omnitrophica bacterium]|nr:hypothetical protein [Candidatus Omnitrophota bacterium]